MLTSLFAKLKEKKPEEEELEKAAKKTAGVEEFIKTADAQKFIRQWSMKKDSQGRRVYTKRGVTALLSALHQVPGLDSDKGVLKAADEILLKLRGMDGLQGFLLGWKAKSEGIMKGLKRIVGKG